MQITEKINIAEAKPGMMVAESVFVGSGGANMMVVRHDTVLDEKTIGLLNRYEVKRISVYVPGEGAKLRGTNLEERPEAEIRFETTPGQVKPILGEELRLEAIESIREIFTAFQKPGEDVNRAHAFHIVSRFERMLNLLVPAVTRDISGLIHIQDLKSYDDYPYNHSLSVAVLCVATGQALGFDVWKQLRLARCAILHDVGKPYVPENISQKKGKLTEEEFDVIKEHAIMGATNLKNKGFGDSELWNGVMFHHEKIDGSGYPKKLRGKEIPLFSRIIAVADMYDAMTSYRPYREALSPAEAFETISSEVGKTLDYDIVMAFTKNLMLYPVGTAVELSDGRVGIVTNNESVQRPTIEFRETGELLDLSLPNYMNLTIAKIFGRD